MIDCQPAFREAHYLDGFAYPDRKFRFKPDWTTVPSPERGRRRPVADDAGAAGPLAGDRGGRRTSIRSGSRPARRGSSSTRPSTRRRPRSRKERRPEVMIHPDDARALGIADGDRVRLGNARGEVLLHARLFEGVRRGVLIAESIWPNDALPRRPRHQHAHRRRPGRALWRRRLPRQPGGAGARRP